jgi:hypothetical protein
MTKSIFSKQFWHRFRVLFSFRSSPVVFDHRLLSCNPSGWKCELISRSNAFKNSIPHRRPAMELFSWGQLAASIPA